MNVGLRRNTNKDQEPTFNLNLVQIFIFTSLARSITSSSLSTTRFLEKCKFLLFHDSFLVSSAGVHCVQSSEARVYVRQWGAMKKI